jgi:hypothetical protein
MLDLLAEGTALRNAGMVLGPEDDWQGWKRQEKDFAHRVFETVAAIDRADLGYVAILGSTDGEVGRGKLDIRSDSPLIADPEKSFVCHDARLDRMRDLITRHSERYGRISDGTAVRHERGYIKQDLPLVEEMRLAVRGGASIPDAAGEVVGRAAGGGTEKSKAKRLERLYIKVHRG